MRHLTEIREHYVTEFVERQIVGLEWIPPRQQLADIFTKLLTFTSHEQLTEEYLTYENDEQGKETNYFFSDMLTDGMRGEWRIGQPEHTCTWRIL